MRKILSESCPTGIGIGEIKVFVNKHLQDGTVYQSGDMLICGSNVAYGLCFMNGVDETSIKAAMNIAREELKK